MDRFTIIPEDKFISVDGEGFLDIDFTIDESIHAVQWYGTYDQIEYKRYFDGSKLVSPENTFFEDYLEFQPMFDSWQLRKNNPPKSE